MKQRNTKQPKKDITLMTLLAYEATGDSRKLLKKYNMPDAKSYGDLEIKLCELYYNTADEEKKALEKELAQIHPHKKWILRNVSHNCECDECKKNRQENNTIPQPTPQQIDSLRSNADGTSDNKQTTPIDLNNVLAYAGLIGVVGVTLTIALVGLKVVNNK